MSMATSTIKRNSVVFATTQVPINLEPSETKYFATPKPDSNYAWHLYAINVGTGNLLVNDFDGNGNGMRIMNKNVSQGWANPITLFWIGV